MVPLYEGTRKMSKKPPCFMTFARIVAIFSCMCGAGCRDRGGGAQRARLRHALSRDRKALLHALILKMLPRLLPELGRLRGDRLGRRHRHRRRILHRAVNQRRCCLHRRVDTLPRFLRHWHEICTRSKRWVVRVAAARRASTRATSWGSRDGLMLPVGLLGVAVSTALSHAAEARSETTAARSEIECSSSKARTL